MLSISTDFAAGTGCPENDLRFIADAGFTHLHWCHQWNTDFLYGDAELAQIETWLRDLALGVIDLHGSHGREKNWVSSREYERLAGVELVENRIAMTARLGADVCIMHANPDDDQPYDEFWDQLRRSLDALRATCRERGVRIAVENGDLQIIRDILGVYEPEFVGFCYDSGHANKEPDGIAKAEALRHRLISIHLHDNDGDSDQHKPIFSGTIDWPRVAALLADSAYTKCVNMEVEMRCSGFTDKPAFLAHVFDTGERLTAMIQAARG